MTTTWWIIAGAVIWTALALGAGIVIGKAIRAADIERELERADDEWNKIINEWNDELGDDDI